MNELHFTYKIRQHLNRGLHELAPETTSRLAIARKNALAHQKKPATQSLLAAAGAFVHFDFGGGYLRQFVMACFLLAAVVSSTFWMADRRVQEIGAIDSALLTEDLPIGVFTDKGFNAWLKHTSQE